MEIEGLIYLQEPRTPDPRRARADKNLFLPHFGKGKKRGEGSGEENTIEKDIFYSVCLYNRTKIEKQLQMQRGELWTSLV